MTGSVGDKVKAECNLFPYAVRKSQAQCMTPGGPKGRCCMETAKQIRESE